MIDFFKNIKGKSINFAKPYILYVGNRSGHKNFIGFIKAFSKSNILKKELNIVAFGGGKFNSFEKQLINRLGYTANQVIQVDGNDELLANYYKQAVFLVYPSLYEGFGLPILEAMACGCPVLSSNTSSMPDIVGNSGELFNPLNTEEMKYIMEKVFLSDSKKKVLIDSGYKNIINYSWKKCASETLDTYKKLLSI